MTEPKQDRPPFVSIVIPCRNEVSSIERSLDSIIVQDYPAECIEVLVVDGMSEDGTREAIQRVIERQRQMKEEMQQSARVNPHIAGCPASIVLLDNPQRIVPTALNIGLKRAQGAIIFRLDGHSEMAHNYVRACVARLENNPDLTCVGGPSIANGTGLVGGAYALALQSPFGVGGRTFRTLRSEYYVDTLAFGGYRREVFAEFGEFDPDLPRNQDIRFNAVLRQAGHRQLLIPDTHTVYHAPKHLRPIIRQNYRNGCWNTKVLDKMVGVLSWRHFVPLIFVVCLSLALLGAAVMPWGGYPALLICGSYLVAALFASLALARRHRRRCAFLLPLLFPIMHVSYGVGSLVGLCQYLGRVTGKIAATKRKK